ncbi:ABC transporter permease [Nonomuraea sp. NPDC050310]|uniref:ABC transporter permease n=1 Tax=unclassified Nonomuraea TaxID=2593643 RepID=UPI0033FA7EE3
MIRDTTLFLRYEVAKTFRNPVWLLLGIMQPVLYLLMFAPLTSGLYGGSSEEALRAFTPAALMMIAVFGSLFTGFGLIAELRNGSLERLAVSPAWRPAIVLGRVFRDMLTLVTQAIIVFIVAALMGLRIGVLELLLMLLLMAATGLFASSLSQGLALAVRDEQGMSSIIQTFMLPVMLLAGLFLDISFAPDWMQAVAPVNPLYHAVEAGRALFRGEVGSVEVPLAFGLFIVLAALTTTWSVRSLRRLAG